eukprot:CAMPEP_0116899812 /NCGR_PEP_ID=MMETSP0467-20121206/8302_1 /TAXON_ID=283647 /ORGANISM="Mesodinium pulex, Strain SPMC105" /LENGTH=112 /DNA_ID=CAMNT_0004572849 /DNA_START=131 /DNA_END=469 /DNA_ORIENTATION=+
MGHEKSVDSLHNLMQQIDKNTSQQVDFDEFKHLMVQLTKENESEEALVETFRCFDRDARGWIDSDEVKEFLNIIGVNATYEDVEDMISDVCSDSQNKHISYRDFRKMLGYNY